MSSVDPSNSRTQLLAITDFLCHNDGCFGNNFGVHPMRWEVAVNKHGEPTNPSAVMCPHCGEEGLAVDA